MNKILHWFPNIVLTGALLALAACNLPVNPGPSVFTETPAPTPVPPTPTPDPELTGAACLVGTWEVQGLDTYIGSILPPEIQQQGKITIENSTGQMLYTFDDQGAASVNADNFTLNGSAETSFLKLPAQAVLNGSSTASYMADDETGALQFSNPVNHGLAISAKVSGITIVDNLSIDNNIWFSGSGVSPSIAFTCQGNNLTVTPPVEPAVPPIGLIRVAP